ncbi:hypothetical protein [Bradyrhizobium sp. RT10b]
MLHGFNFDFSWVPAALLLAAVGAVAIIGSLIVGAVYVVQHIHWVA